MNAVLAWEEKHTQLLVLFCVPCLLLQLSGCKGARVLSDPVPLDRETALQVTEDARLQLSLDGVIVRDGPGAWASNTDWDEYLLSVRNLGTEPVVIEAIRLVDALDYPLDSYSDRKQLVEMSRETVKRFEQLDIRVEAGLGGSALLAAGLGAGVVGVSVGTAVAIGATTTGAATAGAAAVAIVGLLAAPVLVGGAAVRASRNSQVQKAISQRSTFFPLSLEPQSAANVDVFFPLAPAPKRVELRYVTDGQTYILNLDTASTLKGLHILADEAPAE